MNLAERLEQAREILLEAGKISLKYFQKDDLKIDLKSDDTPVTVADKETEEFIRDKLQKLFPEDGIVGEEWDDVASQSGYQWIIDPIDGTEPFSQGVPLYGNLLALEEIKTQEVVLGYSNMPAMGEFVYAGKDLGAYWEVLREGHCIKKRARVSETKDFSRALYSTASLGAFKDGKILDALRSRSDRGRGWSDCYGHMLVATGRIDIMVDPLVKVWDVAPFQVILKEAGGVFCDFSGKIDTRSGSALTTNPYLIEECLSITRGK